VLDDLLMLTGRISDAHPGIPIFLFGHSMGSLLGAALIERHGERFRAAVLSGVFVDRPIRRELSPLIARLLSGGRMEEPCQALNDMTFREYNRPFEGRTDFDWLSSLPEEVDKYVVDPLCGFVCTASLYKDLCAADRFAAEPARGRGARRAAGSLRRRGKGLTRRTRGREPVGFVVDEAREERVGQNLCGFAPRGAQ
jgi:alpha-beta hydrolase superfamily lysophospholipase